MLDLLFFHQAPRDLPQTGHRATEGVGQHEFPHSPLETGRRGGGRGSIYTQQVPELGQGGSWQIRTHETSNELDRQQIINRNRWEGSDGLWTSGHKNSELLCLLSCQLRQTSSYLLFTVIIKCVELVCQGYFYKYFMKNVQGRNTRTAQHWHPTFYMAQKHQSGILGKCRH